MKLYIFRKNKTYAHQDNRQACRCTSVFFHSFLLQFFCCTAFFFLGIILWLVEMNRILCRLLIWHHIHRLFTFIMNSNETVLFNLEWDVRSCFHKNKVIVFYFLGSLLSFHVIFLSLSEFLSFYFILFSSVFLQVISFLK